jgi:hypothetical protein
MSDGAIRRPAALAVVTAITAMRNTAKRRRIRWCMMILVPSSFVEIFASVLPG